MSISGNELRLKSIETLKQHNIQVNPNLPFLDVGFIRSQEEVIRQTQLLHVSLAIRYGFDKDQGIEWIKQNVSEATESTTLPIEDLYELEPQSDVEALWVLAWSLNIIYDLDSSSLCSNDFVHRMPDLKKAQSWNEYIKHRNITLRNKNTIYEQADMYYCLHSSIVSKT